MATGYEVKMYGDISRIAMALEQLVEATQHLADVTEKGLSGSDWEWVPDTTGEAGSWHRITPEPR